MFWCQDTLWQPEPVGCPGCALWLDTLLGARAFRGEVLCRGYSDSAAFPPRLALRTGGGGVHTPRSSGAPASVSLISMRVVFKDVAQERLVILSSEQRGLLSLLYFQ